MRLAIISDIHVEFLEAQNTSQEKLKELNRVQIMGEFSLPVEIDADVIIVAGDIHPNNVKRHMIIETIEKAYKVPVLYVNGNHDYYRHDFPYPSVKIVNINGIVFALGTLWTDLTAIPEYINYPISDLKLIKNVTFRDWTRNHMFERNILLSDEYDVVVSHHLPSKLLSAEKYEGDSLNPFFYTDYTKLIEKFERTRLWVCGHTHNRYDFQIGACRMVCNPLGYKYENYRSVCDYEPLIVEVF